MTARTLAAALLFVGLFPGPAGPVRAQGPAPVLPATFDAQADRFEALSQDEFLLQGNVTFKADDLLLQADRVTYNHVTRTGEAQGNVLYVQGPVRIAGESVTFDIGAETAELTNATGFLESGFMFQAERILQLDRRRVRFERGFFTACTQPVPYWSFAVRSGLIVRERYVHLYSLALKAGRVPIFYSPYLVFPIKPDRATGMLLPQIGFSQRLGSSLGNAFFWDIARNQDATFFVDAYSEGSLGTGAEYRLIPNARGAAIFNGYFIQEDGLSLEDQPERKRWNVRFKQRQDDSKGGRFIADFNFVSDADYFLDFSRDLDRGSDPAAFSRAEYVMNRGYTSYNFRAERREQFFSGGDVTQLRLPETELRMRSRRLGGSPFFLALEGSASVLDRSAPTSPMGTYGRLDVFPTLSLPLSPTPYFDLTPTLRVRETYYTRALDAGDPTRYSSGLSREFLQFDIQALGPRLARVITGDGGGKLKSTIEPTLIYRYQTAPGSDQNFRVPIFDEIDILPGDLNEFEFGATSRLFARRVARASAFDAGQLSAAADLLGRRAPDDELPEEFVPEEDDLLLASPVEIASFFIRQRYSLQRSLSFDTEFLDTDADGVPDTTVTVDESRFSPIALGARINPTRGTSIDTRVDLDVLEKTVSTASFSAGLFDPRRGFLNATWFYRNGLNGVALDSSNLRVSGGTSFFRHKISTAVALNYDSTRSQLQDQRYRFGYDTQCCGFALEVLERDFIGTRQREFRFVINLRGIGNFIDLQGGGTGR